MDLATYTRIEHEHSVVDNNIEELVNFLLYNPLFQELSEENKFLLNLQLQTMCNYRDILRRRLTINKS